MPIFDIPPSNNDGLFDVSRAERPAVLRAGRAEWYAHAAQFRHGAELLADGVVSGRAAPESVGMPMLYCYRHWIELSLKGLLVDAGYVCNEDEQIHAHHRLLTLWTQLRVRVERMSRRGDEASLDRVSAIVAEIDAMDPRSDAFRYPVNVRGNAMLSGARAVDLAQVARVMRELGAILDGLEAMLVVYRSAKVEIDADAAHYGWAHGPATPA
jgi:hypothetical protein